MIFSDKALHLTYDEFYVLMCLFGANNVQGTFVENYYEISPDNLEKMWDKCRESLALKGYIVLSNDDIQLDIGLYCILNECIKAEKKYSVQLSKGKNKIMDTLFYDRVRSLICINNCVEKKEICLNYCIKKNIYTDIVKKIQLTDQVEFEEIPFEITFSQQEYFTLMSSVNMEDYSKALKLFPDDIPEKCSMDLVNSLKNSGGILSVQEFNQDEISSYDILLGESFFWAIYAQDQDSISFKLVSKQDVDEILAQTFGCDGGVSR